MRKNNVDICRDSALAYANSNRWIWRGRYCSTCAPTMYHEAKRPGSALATCKLSSALDRGCLDFSVIRDTFNVAFVDGLLDSLDRLISKRLVLKHCIIVSMRSSCDPLRLYLQKASSSSVRLYVSGYIKYTNVNSNVIHPQ